MPATETSESPIYRLTLIIDGVVILSREFKREHAAIRAYDRATALYGLGTRKPKLSGIARVDHNFEPLKRCEWRPGFGWY